MYDLYDIFCAILYVNKGGVQWRLLPSDFPKWQNVYYHFCGWSEKDENGVSTLDKVLKKLVTQIRNEDGRRDKTSFGIIDAQSVKNASPAEEKGYDAEKTSGIKRHVVDTMGLPHAIYVTTANVTDRDGALQMIQLNLVHLSCVERFLVDGGYSGKKFAACVNELCGSDVRVVKRNELHKLVVLPQRWVVERFFGWLNYYRRLWKNCERKLSTSFEMVALAAIAILLKRF